MNGINTVAFETENPNPFHESKKIGKAIQIPATITRISTTADNGISFTIRSQELSPEMKLTVMEMHNAFGWFMFRENKFSDEEVPKEEAVEKDRKTDSQRLRGVLWLLHKQLSGKEEDFEFFRHEYMEKFINEVKAKLE